MQTRRLVDFLDIEQTPDQRAKVFIPRPFWIAEEEGFASVPGADVSRW
jgi:hypothetical protein